MSVSATSFNYAFSPDAIRAASAYANQSNARVNDAAEQVLNSLAGDAAGLAPGTTITARYQYKVGPDGTLLPTQTRITTESADGTTLDEGVDEGGSRRRAFYRQADDRRPSFSDITQPRPRLSPAEEVIIFATATGEEIAPRQAPTASTSPIQGEAVADDGSAVDVEILTANTLIGNASQQNTASTASRAQNAVATLYARNNDVVYTATAATRLAA